MLTLLKNDSWLMPYEKAIEGRYQNAQRKVKELTQDGKSSLSDFSSGYLYFGLHKTSNAWIFREWAPHASEIYLIGTFNNWQKDNKYKLNRIDNGNWEVELPLDAMILRLQR